LRKLNYQYEEQNAILSTHVDELKKIVSSLEEEANLQRSNNIALVQHLESLRDTLASNFAKIPLPGECYFHSCLQNQYYQYANACFF